MTTALKVTCNRYQDGQIIKNLDQISQKIKEINSESNPIIRVVQVLGTPEMTVVLTAKEITNPDAHIFIEEIKEEETTLFHSFSVHINEANPQNTNFSQPYSFIKYVRNFSSTFDELTVDIQPNIPEDKRKIKSSKFISIIKVVKELFKPFEIEDSLKWFSNDEIVNYYRARESTLTQLQNTSTTILKQITDHQVQLENEFKRRVEDLNQEFQAKEASLEKSIEERKQQIEEQNNEKIQNLQVKDAEFQKKLEEFETRESRYLRRSLRKEMLDKLVEMTGKDSSLLSPKTKRLRWPTFILCSILLGFFGTLTGINIWQTSTALSFGEVNGTTNSMEFIFLIFKQIAFAGAFLGIAWYLLKWNDRWLKQHTNAELSFKQLELDINRASWIVEMAMEWREEKGEEIPQELLERLSRNLFYSKGTKSEEEDHTDFMTLLLGNSSGLKFKTPTGAEFDMSRKNLRNFTKKSSEPST